MAGLYKHIFLSGIARTEKYKTSPKIGPKALIPERDRAMHSQKLLTQFDTIWKQKETLQKSRSAEKIATRTGTYLSFTGAVDHDLMIKSLENIKKGIRLLNVQDGYINEKQKQTRATVFIPNGMEGYFISKIVKYQTEDSKTNKPKNAPLVNSIEDVSNALLEGLWTDKIEFLPEESSKWCEVWLNIDTINNREKEQISEFFRTLENIGIESKESTIIFPERAVLLANANKGQLIELMLQSDLLAELRAGQEPAGFWMNESSIEQQGWVEDLLQRTDLQDSTIKVCILDTGVNNGHQLLQTILSDSDSLTVNATWGTNDHSRLRGGHGTLMAGIAGYGNLEDALTSRSKVILTHKLCSVKILPPPHASDTPKELWGDITAQGVAIAEIENPHSYLIYCMAVTSKDGASKGRPTSWSGALDKITYGDGENQKLILVSAGNIRDEEDQKNYPDSNFVTSIENPAQSWNALTVGAYTQKIKVTDESYNYHELVANENELSPYSTTSLCWEKKWPLKPEVVFEGGNLLKDPNGNIVGHTDLELLSTSKSFNIKPFETINATSASTAQSSWFAAKVTYEYPTAWPETIRALMVHSARWTQEMLHQMNINPHSRSDYNNMLRVFGFGIPNIADALYSKENAFKIITQEVIQPFSLNSEGIPETNEIHFYNFPWPKDLLLSLGSTPVRLKITLSYFIEPGPGEIGWKDKYRYQSHGLRFDINNIGETEDVFRKRINHAARVEGDEISGNSGSNRWTLGANNRSNGSIHSDFWDSTAADLATCNFIAIYPVIGWWKERKHLLKVNKKTRYSLIVSIETPIQEVELYTTVKNLIEVPISIAT